MQQPGQGRGKGGHQGGEEGQRRWKEERTNIGKCQREGGDKGAKREGRGEQGGREGGGNGTQCGRSCPKDKTTGQNSALNKDLHIGTDARVTVRCPEGQQYSAATQGKGNLRGHPARPRRSRATRERSASSVRAQRLTDNTTPRGTTTSARPAKAAKAASREAGARR